MNNQFSIPCPKCLGKTGKTCPKCKGLGAIPVKVIKKKGMF